MIIDKHLTFVLGKDNPQTTTRSVCLTQSDLPVVTPGGVEQTGMGPYNAGLFLYVAAAEAGVTGLTVTIEHSTEEEGSYDELVTFNQLPTATGKEGDVLVKAPFPFPSRNWVRLKFSAAKKLNAFLVHGVDKGVFLND